MPCKVELLDRLTKKVQQQSEGLDVVNIVKAKETAKQINKRFGYDVISIKQGENEYTNKIDISIPKELVEEYYQSELKIEQTEARNIQAVDAERIGEEQSDNYMMQLNDVPVSKSSPETLSKIKEAAKKMGIDIQRLSDYLKGNPNVDSKGINGIADLVKGVIAITEGKENIALTEEVVHVANAIIAQTHPNLVTEMISKIDRFGIYKTVFDQYKNNKNYQLSNGKPDVRKIKQEAVDKLLVEVIINKNEGDTEFPELRQEVNRSIIRVWWDKMLDAIRGMYKKANIDIFNEVENKIINQTNIQNEFSRISERVGLRISETTIPRDFELLFNETTNKTPLGFDKNGYQSIGLFRNSSLYQKVNGRTFRDISSGKINLDEREVEQYTIIRVLQSLFENSFNKGLAKKLGVGSIMVINSSREHPLRIQNKILTININKNSGLFNHIIKNSIENTENDLLDTAVSEELIHLVSTKLTNSTEVSKAYSELTQEDKVQILQTYFHDNNLVNTTLLKPYEYVHEYIRMQIQKKVLGYTTEEKRTTLAKIIQKVWDYLGNLLSQYTSLKSIYDKTLNFIETGEGDLNNNPSEGILGLAPISDEQKSVQDKLMATQETLRKQSIDKSDDLLVEDEADNFYERQKSDGIWERVKHRVTDRVKNIYNQLFKNKTFTEGEKKYNEARRSAGVLFHSYMEEIHSRWFNEDGTKRETIQDRPNINNSQREVYSVLENYFSDLIKSLSEDTLVFSEIKVYDPKKDEAGTIDFFAIDKDGKGHILDWKFMTIKEGNKDIPWYKKEAFDIQLGRYKDILKTQYGLKSVGMIRAIPVLMRMTLDKTTDEYVVNGINIGSVDVSKITDLKLLPVSEKTESTGIDRLDKAIAKLNAALSNIKTQKVTDESSRQFKNERINTLTQAIRFAQTQQNLKPLIDSISIIKQEGSGILNDWNTIWKERDFKGLENKEKSEFAEKMHNYRDIALAFEDIEGLIRKIIYDKDEAAKAISEDEKKDFEFRKDIVNNLRSEVEDIIESRKEIEDISKEFANKFMGWANNITGLLSPEKILRGLSATFYNISMLSHASLEILQKLIVDSSITANRNALGRVNKLLEIRQQLKDAGGIMEVTKKIYQRSEKGDIMNKLFYKYDKEFYNKVDENALSEIPDIKWVKENIDVEAYKKVAKDIIDRSTIKYKNDYEHDEKTAKELITELNRKWNIDNSNFNGWNNWLIKRYPLEKWLSKEYKDIQSNRPLADLYDMIYDVNHEAAAIGYIDNKVISTFLPFIKQGFAEKIAWNQNPLEMMNWERSLRINSNDTGFGRINDLNGKYDHSIPKYFTYDFTKEGEKASEDVFKNLILYFSHVEKYRELTNLEGQIKILQDVEELKNHLETNRIGILQKDKQGRAIEAKGNEKNTEVLDKFVRVLLYGEKYVDSNTDVALNIHPQERMKKIVNSIAGHEVYRIDENPDPLSLTKVIDAMNQFFRVKTLGGNVVSGAAVYFGSSMQVMEQAGRYFTAGEFRKNNAIVFRNKFSGKEKEMQVQLNETFMPLRESIMDDKLRGAGMSAMTNLDIKHKLMMVMSFPSAVVEQSIFLSLLENSMIEDGKIVNIREYVNSKYADRYTSAQVVKDSKNKIENEIKELQKTRSIDAIKKLEDGKLVIPGLDLSNIKELDRLTKLTRRIGETSTHGRTASDANQSAMNIWLNSMMVFKTWMPKLIRTRFDVLEKVSDDFSVKIDDKGNITGERYDMGRIRIFLHVMGSSIRNKSMNIINILSMNEKGIKTLDEMFDFYSKDYENRTGKPLNMTREDFFDMIKDNLHNEVRELSMLLLLTAAIFSTGFLAPGDNKDKKAKNATAFFHKVLNKFHDQLGMFYDPREWAKVLNGGLFPSMGIFGDIGKFMEHSILEFTGWDIVHPLTSRDDVLKKAQPVKYALEMFPISKAFITYMSMLDSQFAKDWNVTISAQNLK